MTTKFEEFKKTYERVNKAMEGIRKPFEKLGEPFVDGASEKPKKDLKQDGAGKVGEIPEGSAPFVDGVDEKPKKDVSFGGSGSVGEMPKGDLDDGATGEKPKKGLN